MSLQIYVRDTVSDVGTIVDIAPTILIGRGQ